MSDQTKAYEFIRANTGATTKVIEEGARVRHERVTAILAEGVASGDLVMTAGFWGSQSYELAKTPDPKIPVPEPQILVPAAQMLPLDPGYAVLRQEPGVSATRPIPTDSQDGKQSSEVVNVPIAEPSPEAAPESWLVELRQACRAAAEQGIRDAMAQMAEQSQGANPEERPVDPVAEGLLREINSGAHRRANPSRFIVR